MKNNDKIPNRAVPFIWYFIKSCKFKILQVYSISIFNDILYLFGSAYMYKLLSNHTNSNTLVFKNDLVYIILFVYSTINYTFTLFLIKSADTKWRNSVEFNSTMKLFLNTINHDISYFNNNLSGNLAIKIKNITDGVNEIFTNLYYVLFNNLTFYIALAIFSTISIWLVVFSAVWYLSFYAVLIILKNKISKVAEENSKEKSKSIGIINDCFTNINNIKMFANEKKEYKLVRKQSLNILRSEAEILFVINKMHLATYFFTSSFVFGTVIICFIEFKKGLVDLGTVMFVLSFSSLMGWFIVNAIKNLMKIISNCGVINDSLKLLTQPITIKDKNRTDKIIVNNGKIVFKNIRFGYEGK